MRDRDLRRSNLALGWSKPQGHNTPETRMRAHTHKTAWAGGVEGYFVSREKRDCCARLNAVFSPLACRRTLFFVYDPQTPEFSVRDCVTSVLSVCGCTCGHSPRPGVARPPRTRPRQRGPRPPRARPLERSPPRAPAPRARARPREPPPARARRAQ